MQTDIGPARRVVSGREQPSKEKRKESQNEEVFLWDEHMVETLTEAFLQNKNEETRAACKEIAAALGWPAPIVEKKVRALQLPRSKRYQQEMQRRAATRQVEEIHENTLLGGPFVWRVSIDRPENRVSWLLGYAYGEFPHCFQSSEVFYKGIRYQVIRIHTQMLSVCSSPHHTGSPPADAPDVSSSTTRAEE